MNIIELEKLVMDKLDSQKYLETGKAKITLDINLVYNLMHLWSSVLNFMEFSHDPEYVKQFETRLLMLENLK